VALLSEPEGAHPPAGPNLGAEVRRPVLEPGAGSGADAGGHTVVRGSAWFVASVAVGAGLSFAFWLVAARLDHSAAFGPASSLWAQLQLVNYLTGMGLPLALARYGTGRTRTVHVLFAWALLYTAATSLIGTVIYALVAPGLIDQAYLAPLWRWGPFGLALFFVLMTGMSFALLVEVRLVTLRRWRWVLGRVLLLSLARFPLVAIPLLHGDAVGLLVLMAGLPALSGFVGVAVLWAVTPARDRAPLVPLPAEARPALTFATVNYLGMLAAQAPQFALPVVVTGFVPTDQFAAFYLAWQVTVMLFLVPHTIGQIVLSEGSRADQDVRRQVRMGMVLSVSAMVGVALIVAASARFGVVTLVLGGDFALAVDVLPWLVAAGVPWAVTSICLARARVAGDNARTVATTVTFAAMTLAPAVVATARWGVTGTTWAWLGGNMVAAALAVVLTRGSSARA
jgi:O-antigen/teichoic acid export membrane protein